jgi:hypothetical protein
MAKIIFRPAHYLQWTQLHREDLTVEEMRDRLCAFPFVDCSFIGEIMHQLYGSAHHDVEVWESEFVSFESGVLVFSASWSYFHDRRTRHLNVHIMEGEL